jgi:heavy-metal exporter, HME family
MFQWLLNNSLASRLLVPGRRRAADGLRRLRGAAAAGRRLPDLNKPTVTLMTESGGMAAEEVEQLVTFPLETALNGLPGVAGVRSVSASGPVLRLCHLRLGHRHLPRPADGRRAPDRAAGQLPPGVVPHMGPVSSIMGEIMHAGDPARSEREATPMAAREYADWVLRPRLMAVARRRQVIPIGGEVRQFQVQPIPARMAELGHHADELEGALKGYSANTSGGFLEVNGREYLIRHLGRSASLENLQQSGVDRKRRPADPAAPGRRGDLRRRHQARRRRLQRRAGGDPGIQKQPTADTVDADPRLEARSPRC